MPRLQITLQCVEHTTSSIELKRTLDQLPVDALVQVKVEGELYLCQILDYEEKVNNGIRKRRAPQGSSER